MRMTKKWARTGGQALSFRIFFLTNYCTGAAPTVSATGPIKATLLCESHNPSTKGAPSSPLESDAQPLTGPSKMGDFPLKFMAGTRKAAVHLKFGVPVRSPMNTATVESDIQLASPFSHFAFFLLSFAGLEKHRNTAIKCYTEQDQSGPTHLRLYYCYYLNLLTFHIDVTSICSNYERVPVGR